jgi:hypothetical protein
MGRGHVLEAQQQQLPLLPPLLLLLLWLPSPHKSPALSLLLPRQLLQMQRLQQQQMQPLAAVAAGRSHRGLGCLAQAA